ncbi:helicase [Lactococcus hodotermopsidis]|uniref:Helicase n=1 Tax=Pseudolactococcus hodotermopsidis TaxID=2709157 RepID=A0A6A0BCM6_9LACT|nr:DEAD/DEAH box helicase [Lactococcus hodotermopsidis]GFH42606.1 helicase [Lactococcus hodotermopsidis]
METLFGRIQTRQELAQNGAKLPENVEQLTGMVVNGKHATCNRCGTTSLLDEVKLEIPAYFCPECLNLGRVRSDEFLYHLPQQIFPVCTPLLWTGTLTPYQAEISAELVRAVAEKTQILVHAVTGAGKTEMIYAAVAKAISVGGAVGIATPRTDVARELFTRLSHDFSVKISLLHADSEPYFRTPLVISTTHQLLRFREAFDLLIIDEVDAFPFADNDALYFAAEHARKITSTLIYLTATSTDKLDKLVKSGELTKVALSRRFHGNPLVVPQTFFSDSEKIICRHLKKQRKTGFPLLIFAPVIAFGQSFSERLTRHFPDEQIGFVASTTENRADIIEEFRQGKLSILVSTTILERGVTFPKVDVFVVNAHHRLFTKSSLIQIAGRAGRSPERPTGLVYFFHTGLTQDITRAIAEIRQMNKLGGFS